VKPVKASWLKPFDQEINNNDDDNQGEHQKQLLLPLNIVSKAL